MTGNNNDSPFPRFVASEYRNDPLSILSAFEHEFSSLVNRFGGDWNAISSSLPHASGGAKTKFAKNHHFTKGKNEFRGKTAFWFEFKQTRDGLVYPLLTANCYSRGEETVSSLNLLWDEFKLAGGRNFADDEKRRKRLAERDTKRKALEQQQAAAAEREKFDQAVRTELHEYFRELFDRGRPEDGSHPYLQEKSVATIARHADLRRVSGSLSEFNTLLVKKGLRPITTLKDQRHYEREFSECMAFVLTDIYGQYVGLQRFYWRKDFRTGRWSTGKFQTVSIRDGQFKGAHCVIGDIKNADTVAVVEGFATGASVYLAGYETGKSLAVVVAISADNVRDVLNAWRKAAPREFERMVLFTDNDAWKAREGKGNKGLLNGLDMAYNHRISVVCPDFERLSQEQLQRWARKRQPELANASAAEILAAKKPTDYNDLHELGTIQAVVEQLEPRRGCKLKAAADYFEFCLQRLPYVPSFNAEDEAYAALKAGLQMAPFKYPSSQELLSIVLESLPLGVKIDAARLKRRMTYAIKYKMKKAQEQRGISEPVQKRITGYYKIKGIRSCHGNRELPRRLVDKIEKSEGIFIIRAPKGSGKTSKLIGPLVHRSTYAAYIAHRIALIGGTAQKLQITDYQYVERMDAPGVDRLAICVNSIVQEKFHQAGAIKWPDALCIDEAVQTLRHIATGTVDDRVAVLEKLIELMRATPRVVLCDADANDLLVEFCELNAPGRPIYVIDMDTDGTAFTVDFGEGAQVFEMASQAAAEGDRVLIATDSQNECDRLALRIKELAGDKPPKVLVVHQQSREEKGDEGERVRRFLASPNEELKHYDTVIYSPTMGTGVSIEKPHFKRHFGIFYGVILPTDAMQMLHRDRTGKQFVIGLGFQGGNRIASKEELALGLMAAKQTDEDGEVIVEHVPGEITARMATEPFDELKLSVMAMENGARNDFANHMLLGLMGDRYRVQRMVDNLELLQRGREAQKETGAAVKLERQLRVLAAQTPDDDEYFRLQMKDMRSREDHAQIARYEIANVLCAPEVTLDDIDFLEHGGLRKMAAFEDIRIERARLAAYDRWQTGKGIASTLRAYRTASSSIRRKAIELLGLDLQTGQGDFTHVEAQNVINWLVEDPTRVSRWNYLKLGQPLNMKRLPKQPTVFIDSMLERMGLKSVARKSRGRKIRSLDTEALARMQTYWERRQTRGISSVTVPLGETSTNSTATAGKPLPVTSVVGDTRHVYIQTGIDHPQEIEQECEIEDHMAPSSYDHETDLVRDARRYGMREVPEEDSERVFAHGEWGDA